MNQALGYEKQLPARKTQGVAQVLKECPDNEMQPICDQSQSRTKKISAYNNIWGFGTCQTPRCGCDRPGT